MAYLLNLYQHRELLRNLVLRDLRMKYGGSVGFSPWGLLFSLFQPLSTIVVYAVVFGMIFTVRHDRFPLFLAIGVLHFSLFSGSITRSCSAITGNAGLILNGYFPRMMLPLSVVAADFVVFGTTVTAFLLLYPWLGGQFWAGELVYVGVFLLFAVFILGCSMLCAACQSHFRDFEPMIAIFIQMLFWCTPVVYDVGMVPERIRDVLRYANPLFGYISSFRELLGDDRFPSASQWLTMLVWALVSLVCGVICFRKFEHGFADEL